MATTRRRADGDPMVGPLKSALQKAVRRGEVDYAVTYATELASRDKDALARRLTVIAPEDVDWRILPSVGRSAVADMTGPGWLEDPDALSLVDVTAAMAARPKQREASWLAWCVAGHLNVGLSMGAVTDALEERNHKLLLALLLDASERRALHGPAGVGVMLGADRRPLVQWGLWRAKLGGVGVVESLAAVALGAIDDVSEEQMRLDRVPWHGAPLEFSWVAFDGHTRIGAIALGSVAKKRSLDQRMLKALMFQYESTRSGPSLVPGRWMQEGMQAEATKYGWATPELGAQMWAEVREDVRGMIEWLMRKEGLWIRSA